VPRRKGAPVAEAEGDTPVADRRMPLLEAFGRLAGELDRAKLYKAAAHIALAAEAVRERWMKRREPEDLRTDVEMELGLDEHGRVWMYVEGDAHMIGRKGAVCAEMRRFLVAAVLGDGLGWGAGGGLDT